MEIKKISQQALNKIVLSLLKGKVIIFPTDTVYGFLADAKNKKAVNSIYKIKKRAKSKPLPVFVKDFKMAKKLAEISKEQEKIIKKHWPGKYTFVLKRKKGVKLYGVKKENIALRIPNHKFLNYLLKKVNMPLVQTSVNISNKETLNNISDIIKLFGSNKMIGIIIDAGNLKNAKSSKVIDLTNNEINILRK